jgi:uncharacterized protein (TIGR03435 family)
VTLADLILKAYDVRPYQIKGNRGALESRRFEVVAKLPAGDARKDANRMLQRLLEQRFRLAVHRETQEGRYYELMVDRAGFKLQPTAKAPSERGSVELDPSGKVHIPEGPLGRPVTVAGKNMMTLVSGGRVLIRGNAQPIPSLAAALERCLDGPVRDATNLPGEYDLKLDFATPEVMAVPIAGPPGECPLCGANVEPPLTVFQAVREKLGLRLEVKRGPVELLVIDHADSVPTEN